ncbi:hypothetical protein ACHAXH_004561 [Discostella pseudostelligera]
MSRPTRSILHTSSITISRPRRSARLQPARSHTTIASGVNNIGDHWSDDQSYNSRKVLELRALLRGRGLPISGTKSTLVERLTNNDELHTPSPTNDTKELAVSDVIVQKSKRTKIECEEEKSTQPASSASAPSRCECLPRTRELQLTSKATNRLVVIGVDEAGRGPLAGPVVAAAAIVPTNIQGIIDSKKITKEEERERKYEELIASPGIRYAVAVISAQRIDEINILQATLEGMKLAVLGLMNMDSSNNKHQEDINKSNTVSAERMDLSYVVTGRNDAHESESNLSNNGSDYYALIDGNKIPKDMPCACESLVKGDGREYSIGAASILAKVTRDRLMHEYDKMYPMYNLSQHKGYPTEAHRSAVMKYGASPIHRRTFAPLKSMEFDEQGNVIR